MKKITMPLALIGGLLSCGQALATNWLMLQGTEAPGTSGRAKVWGFIQPEYQSTSGTQLQSGPHNNSNAVFNQIAPNNSTDNTFQIRRARIGVRGTGFPLDSKVNYFILSEFGNNGITQLGGNGSVKLSDASITLNHIPGARIRMGLFKTPSGEESMAAIHVFNYVNFSNFANQELLERFFDEDGSRGNGAGGVVGGVEDGSTNTLSNLTNAPTGAIGAFRDIGLQVFDSFRVDDWDHSYAIMFGNGNGIDRGDNDSNKDLYLKWSSELIYNNSKGPRRQGWKTYAWYQNGKRTLQFANKTAEKQEFDRKRWGVGSIYSKGKLRLSGEYFKADGMIFNGTDAGAVAGNINGGGLVSSFNMLTDEKADGYYLDAGYRVSPTVQLDVRYDKLNRATETAALERQFTTLTVGAQYFLNKKTRAIFNYEFRDAEAPNLAGSHPANQILDGMDDRISLQLLAIF